MKIMISQPMRGRTIEKVKEERLSIEESLRKRGYEIVDNVIGNPLQPNENEAIENLGDSIKLIAKVEKVYFMKGWEYSRGCRIEHEVAVQYGKNIEYEN